jgi:hypothetical protein
MPNRVFNDVNDQLRSKLGGGCTPPVGWVPTTLRSTLRRRLCTVTHMYGEGSTGCYVGAAVGGEA